MCLLISHAYCTLLFPLITPLKKAAQKSHQLLHPAIGFYACLRVTASERVAQGYA